MTRQPQQTPLDHDPRELIRIFNGLFEADYQTRLVRGADEPLYLPAAAGEPYHRVIFAHGYFASALHEISHWCIAGAERRLLEDFGYWYEADGRSAAQQAEFERVEVKPQALEWIFAKACGFRFRVSSDNLHGEAGDNGPFKRNVHAQAIRYLREGMPERAAMLVQALCAHYRRPFPRAEQFDLQELFSWSNRP